MLQVVVVAHSWGDSVFRNFLHWMEQEEQGWAEKYVHAYCNVAGPVLGVPKSISALLSGISTCLLWSRYPFPCADYAAGCFVQADMIQVVNAVTPETERTSSKQGV